MRRSIAIITSVAALSMTIAASASAQLGIIKKMATEKAKEAAGVKDPDGAQKGGGAKIDYTITDERVTAIVASLAPYVETAKRKAAEAAAEKAIIAEREARDAKLKTLSDCLQKATAAGGMPDMGFMQTPKGEALMAKIQSTSTRLAQPGTMKNTLLYAGLMDTTAGLQMQQAAMMFPKANCGAYPYSSMALLKYQAAQLERSQNATADNNMPRGEGELVVPPNQRANMTTGQFGRIREAIAIWLLQQSGDLPPKAYKFTDAENAVLTAKSAQLKELGPLFKTNALTWASWGDIKAW